MKEMTEVLEEASRCVKCGNCLSQCPIYLETLEEPLAARGKLALVESLGDGQPDFTKRFEEILSLCLLCGTCSENCPNGVMGDEIIREARSLLAKKRGLSLPKKAIFKYLLDSDHLMDLLLRGGASLQHLFLKRIPEESGLRLRFPLPALDSRRLIPPLVPAPFLEIHSGWVRAEREVGRAGLFAGCVTNYLFPRIGRSALNLLIEQGISVFIPDGQRCCGLPAFGSGDDETAFSLARRNLEAFSQENLEQIVVPCASCAAMLKLDYPLLFSEAGPLQAKALALSQKVTDVSKFLAKLPDWSSTRSVTWEGGTGRSPLQEPASNFSGGRSDLQGRLLRVTYHDPCHLRRKLGVFKEPRDLLRSTPGLEYVEMAEANRCCGQGGSFNLAHYDLSLKILDRKIQAIEKSGADLVATTCSGCILQLMDGLHQAGSKKEVRHLVEVIVDG